MKVRFGNLDAQYRRLKQEIDRAAARVLESGYYIGGPEVEAFEDSFAGAVGALFAVGVANGTDAISLALLAAGVRPGDEVVVPAVSAYPTVVGVARVGAVPVFVDVLPETGSIDPNRVRESLTPRTKVILPVHLFGIAADIHALAGIARQANVGLVEDAAQAFGVLDQGAPAGSFSKAAAWSFYPTKNLGAAGDAGAVTTSDEHLANRLRRLRNYGQINRYEHVEIGFNSRLDPIQAAILSVKLGHVESENLIRRGLGARFDTAFVGLNSIVPLPIPRGTVPNRHLYPVRLRAPELREKFQRDLLVEGIETLIHYPIAMPDQAASDVAWKRHNQYPVAREFCRSVVSLPLHPDIDRAQEKHLLETIRRWDEVHGPSL